MTRQTMFGLAALSLIAVAYVASSTNVLGQEDAPAGLEYDSRSLFKDKIVLIEFNQSMGMAPESDTVVVQDARTIKIGDKEFLVGLGYTPEDDDGYWYKDMNVGIACDRIYKLSTMTPEQCAKFMKKWKEHLDE